MLVSLALVKNAGLEVPGGVVDAALAALDQMTDAKTGSVLPFKKAKAVDTTEATSAVVMAKLLHGRRPATDQLLGLSWKHLETELDEKSRHIKVYLKAGDLDFWRWTTLCRAQLGNDKAWRWTGFQRAGDAVEAAADGNSDEPAMELALSTMIFGAAYRYERMVRK